MSVESNIDPFCLLNGKLREQLFDYTDDELTSFYKAVQPDVLHEVYSAVEDEYNNQSSTNASAEFITEYLSNLTSSELEDFSAYLKSEVVDTSAVSASLDNPSTIVDVDPSYYTPPKVEMLEGYIAISSSNLKALDKFKDRVMKSSNTTCEHRIKKHGDVTIHSYVFNLNDDSK
jgi:hypothetical protein